MKKSHILSVIKKLISKKAMACLFLSVGVEHAKAQLGSVGIGTANPHPSAILDITASNKGLMLPVVLLTSATDKTTVPNPKVGFVIYNKNIAGIGTNAVKKGLYVYNGTVWEKMLSKAEIKTSVSGLPFVKPVFVASSSGLSGNLQAGRSNFLTFSTLQKNSPAGAQGVAGAYTGYAIQEAGLYLITYVVEVRTSSAAAGYITFEILKNGTTIHTFTNPRQNLFSGASNSYSANLVAGDVIRFRVTMDGSGYQYVNPNVSIRKVNN